MLKALLVLIGVLCFAVLIAWLGKPAWREAIESASSVFSLVASVAALTVFAQFYVTFTQSNEAIAEKDRLARALLVSRITALSAEIISNIQVCNLLQGDKDLYQSGTTVPGIKFQFFVASDLIRSGEITHHKLRAELMSLIMQMEVLNSIIERSAYQMSFRGAFGQEGREAMNKSMGASIHLLLSKASLIRVQLAATQPLIEELLQDPNKYADEEYLRSRLVPDGLIR
ncbi:hypothetical protein HKK55_09500 [Pseudomonas sp. ADAK18]|uniref:hypothetical protein n=1 Tax=Pseudomonas sp. ADAK18 TaxID=2730848 RepID=UPI001462BB9B|nr:hypothetical protein [Pseudomonas sp. ADAK18]QJI28938.1 hypothetical protein HKK55_09500 [Pseudomonas sp. ADAK18]